MGGESTCAKCEVHYFFLLHAVVGNLVGAEGVGRPLGNWDSVSFHSKHRREPIAIAVAIAIFIAATASSSAAGAGAGAGGGGCGGSGGDGGANVAAAIYRHETANAVRDRTGYYQVELVPKPVLLFASKVPILILLGFTWL